MTANFMNQLDRARQILDEKGKEALANPHAAVGRICGCKDCFCCAALTVLNEHNRRLHCDDLDYEARRSN